jgi:hypothetical protein
MGTLDEGAPHNPCLPTSHSPCGALFFHSASIHHRSRSCAARKGAFNFFVLIFATLPCVQEKKINTSPQLVVALTQAGYVRKLLDLFAQCEDLYAESRAFHAV